MQCEWLESIIYILRTFKSIGLYIPICREKLIKNQGKNSKTLYTLQRGLQQLPFASATF